MNNVHKHGITQCAEYVHGVLRKSRNRFQVSVDAFGDVRIRPSCRRYRRALPEDSVIGTYTRDASIVRLESDMRVRLRELRPIYRRAA